MRLLVTGGQDQLALALEEAAVEADDIVIGHGARAGDRPAPQ